MELGINTWVWVAPLTTEHLQRLAPHIAELGFDRIELPLELLEEIDFGRAAQITADAGLGVSCCVAMGPDRDLIHPDEAVRENGMAYVRGCIEGTQKAGGRNLVGPLYSAVGRTWKQAADDRARDLDILVANLRSLADYAGDHGVVLGLEPLNRFETSFINLAEQAIEVIDRVDHPSCGIMLDTFHMNIEEKSLGDAIRATGSRLVHLHSCENDRGAPGTGNVDWDGVAKALKDIHYEGPVVIESFTPDVVSIARAAAIWRPLAKSSDDLASTGLSFLREKLG
ncbi:MAG: sugar phosphate isomerase/epimerase family protein [Candidatus Promineifilaceae bacterium]|nr:sugar phosphate isomerase/epimerase family protein [Candidatus Promineifilaceae bacterium]